jgi:hypothetical protein
MESSRSPPQHAYLNDVTMHKGRLPVGRCLCLGGMVTQPLDHRGEHEGKGLLAVLIQDQKNAASAKLSYASDSINPRQLLL